MTRVGSAARALRATPLLTAALLLAGCGEAQRPVPAGPPTHELRIGMQEYAFQLSAGAVLPGELTVVVTNAGSAEHDVVLEQGGTEIGHSDVLSPGQRQTLEVQVAAGSPIRLECTLTGHSAAGMHAGLDVAGD